MNINEMNSTKSIIDVYGGLFLELSNYKTIEKAHNNCFITCVLNGKKK